MKENPKVFLARAGKYGENEEIALENGIAILGFQDVPSLEGAKDYDAVLKIVKEAFPEEKPRAIGNFAGQLWAFAVAMEEGDIVVLPRKTTSHISLGVVKGPYVYRKIGSEYRHTRTVEWKRTDVPRTAFEQDLLYSFGAFMTVCNISRNDAAKRVMAVLEGKVDPGPSLSIPTAAPGAAPPEESAGDAVPDLGQLAHDQIVANIQARFMGHAMAGLVEAVLRADGWSTRVSPPGADGGVDILAGRGSLGMDAPRLCVQVKSQTTPADVTVYRTLQGRC